MLAELESAYRQLEDALDSQRRFVADASHELRTPLTTVRGNIELLRREPPIAAEERAEVLADTTEEVDRLIRLVNQLLVLARADAGQALRRDPIPVQPLIEDVCRQARLLAPRTEIQCEAPADVLVQGDRDALKQVLLILVDNALVHTPAGTPVALTASRPADTGGLQRARPRPRHRARTRCRTSSSASTAGRPRAPAAAPGWGWPSPRSWWRRRAARSQWRASPARAACSR